MGLLLLDEIAGIAFGVIALVQIARARRLPSEFATGRREGQWIALAGVVVGGVSLVAAIVIYSMRSRR